MRDRGTAARLVVQVVFEPDRLAQASVERAYVRLVPPSMGPVRRGPPPAPATSSTAQLQMRRDE